jgi:Domain of unknown function (DUF4738)
MNRILIISLFLLFVGCGKKDKSMPETDYKTQKKVNNDTTSKKTVLDAKGEPRSSQIDTKYKISSYPQINIDTIMSGVHITYSVKDNKSILSDTIVSGDGRIETHCYADRSLFLSVERRDKIILREKVFDKSFFSSIVPKSELPKNLISFVAVRYVSDTSVAFFVTICKPDSDVCYYIEMAISDNGKVALKELDESEMGE